MKPTVIIVGGGVAGITAAVELTERGYGVTLIEQRSLFGGRAYSFARPGGIELDNGLHVTMGCYRHYRHLLRKIAADDAIGWQPQLQIPFRGVWRGQLLQS